MREVVVAYPMLRCVIGPMVGCISSTLAREHSTKEQSPRALNKLPIIKITKGPDGRMLLPGDEERARFVYAVSLHAKDAMRVVVMEVKRA
jgi:hypothetical protein